VEKCRNVQIINLAKDTPQRRSILARHRKFEFQVCEISEPSSLPSAFPKYYNVFIYPNECTNRLF
jgi:hypothetical protein